MTRTTAAASSHARRNRSRCPFSASSRVRIAAPTRACVIIILPLERVSSDNFVLLTRPLLVDRWLAQTDVAARARQHQLALHVNGYLLRAGNLHRDGPDPPPEQQRSLLPVIPRLER